MPDTLVLVPTYNEIESLSAIVSRLRRAVPDADVLIIDDASPDSWGMRVIMDKLLGARAADADPAEIGPITYLLQSGSDRIRVSTREVNDDF